MHFKSRNGPKEIEQLVKGTNLSLKCLRKRLEKRNILRSKTLAFIFKNLAKKLQIQKQMMEYSSFVNGNL